MRVCVCVRERERVSECVNVRVYVSMGGVCVRENVSMGYMCGAEGMETGAQSGDKKAGYGCVKCA